MIGKTLKGMKPQMVACSSERQRDGFETQVLELSGGETGHAV